MIEFTSSQFQQKPGALYNDVAAAGIVKIVHRSRPEMVVITSEKLAEILNDKIKGLAYLAELQA